MANENLPDAPDSGATCDAALPVSPFVAPRYQFGMLLGVEDFELALAHPRGKARLHNAWLHREGVVWGFGVTAPEKGGAPTGEIRVAPGLALDALGHELHLDCDACLDVAAWYKKLLADKADVPDSGRVALEAHVEARFRACLTRPVPAMSQPCEPGAGGVAYSRVYETVELKLVIGKAPARPTGEPYPLLRLLFGLVAPASPPTDHEQAVLDELAAIEAAPLADRSAKFLNAFRRFAALDVTAMEAGTDAAGSRLFPERADAPLVLADLKLNLDLEGGAPKLIKARVDNTVRASHVATSTIQELNLFARGRAAPAPPPDAGGPRIVKATIAAVAGGPPVAAQPITPELPAGAAPSLVRAGVDIKLEANEPLDPATLHADAFSLSILLDDRWVGARLSVKIDDDHTVTLHAPVPAHYRRVRVVAHGTGATPILGADGIPLAGGVDDPRPGQRFDGHDYAHIWDHTEVK